MRSKRAPTQFRIKGRQGYTLAEVMVSAAIFAVMAMGLFGVIKTGTAVYIADSTLVDLQQQARNAISRIVREARESKVSSITVIDADSDRLTFSTPTENGIMYYRSGNNLVREYPGGTVKNIATMITRLKFTKSAAQLAVTVRAQQTVYNRTVTFSMLEDIKLRNE